MDIGKQIMNFDAAALISQNMLALKNINKSIDDLNPIRRQLAESAPPKIRMKPSEVNLT